MCQQYLFHPPGSVLFYITNVLLPPVLFGLGIMGNLLLLLVFNRHYLRRESPIYVHLTGLCLVDTLALICAVPQYIRHVDLFSMDFAFSKAMTFAMFLQSGLVHVMRHTAIWYTAVTVLIYYATLRYPSAPSRWTRISSNRLLAFLVFVFCLLVNFPRFFEFQVVELVDHCFTGMSLWTLNSTKLADNPIYTDIYPVIVVFLGCLIPLSLLVLFTLLVVCQAGSAICRTKIALRAPKDRDESDLQNSVTLLAIASFLFTLEFLLTFALVFDAFSRDIWIGSPWTVHFLMVAQFLSFLRCVVNFPLVAILSDDFRKTLRRTFCCLCPGYEDEFVEPITCSPCCRKVSPSSECKKKKKKMKASKKKDETRAAEVAANETASYYTAIKDETGIYSDVNSTSGNMDEDKGIWI